MTARSYLYVPGDRPDMLAKSTGRGADALVVDLEDAVAPSRKDAARATVAEWLASVPAGPEIWVRVNSESERLRVDLDAVTESPSLRGIVLPKATAASVASLDGMPRHLAVIPLIETASGLVEVADVAAAPRVARIGLGEADLIAALGMRPSPDGREMLPLRMQVVVASAAAGLEPPIGPVETDLSDPDALAESTAALERMGFGARTAVHPSQIPVINQVFTPDPAQVERARRLLARAAHASEGGAVVFVDDDGRMIDEAVLRSARRIVTRAERAEDAGSTGRNEPR